MRAKALLLNQKMDFSHPQLMGELGKFLLTHASRTTLRLAPCDDVISNPQFFAPSKVTFTTLMFTKHPVSRELLRQYQVYITAEGTVS